MPAPDLKINGERLPLTMIFDDACQYLAWVLGTENGDMSATKKMVREKAEVARDHLIKFHPLTPKLATELFASKGIGAF